VPSIRCPFWRFEAIPYLNPNSNKLQVDQFRAGDTEKDVQESGGGECAEGFEPGLIFAAE